MLKINAKLNTILLTSAAAFALTAVSASADTTYNIQSGDTLSKIANKFQVNINDLAKTNNISNINLIYAGETLTISSDSAQAAPQYQAPAQAAPQIQYQAPVQPAYTATTYTGSYSAPVNYSNNGNANALRRRQIESGNNYQTFTGNGYLGAYQFASSTWAAGVAAVGGSVSDFSSAHQDQVANWYANSRYGGWQNVPTNGGW
ncbi:LysM peptidoglycan-binding domain-containing protein [Oenococcus alcoholitolerans]|uniref:LysM peptidoglycan-binding domain-containing protein n=1 Tax=Oenococcus alcoholitolerans TaxID=931074 RepID=UPI003F6F2599